MAARTARAARTASIRWLLVSSTAVAMPAMAQVPPSCLAGTQAFAPSGAVQTYTVPAGSITLLIVANGAAGGGSMVDVGGHGSSISAAFPAAGLTELEVIVGRAGQMGDIGAGGGGGSFVFTPAATLLVAAGGGGGVGALSDGLDAQLGPDGAAGVGQGGAGGSNGSGGGGGADTPPDMGINGGGGGGFLGPGGDGVGTMQGLGGHQISPPGDAAGGASVIPGGFGGGGGGSDLAGGGGGGYSGGGGGSTFASGGGGGSFVGAGGTPLGASILTTRGDGAVTICVMQADIALVPTLGPGSLVVLASALALLGCLRARQVGRDP